MCNPKTSIGWDTFENEHSGHFKNLNHDKQELFGLMSKQLHKSKIAWDLSYNLDENSDFRIPNYIKDALKFIFEE